MWGIYPIMVIMDAVIAKIEEPDRYMSELLHFVFEIYRSTNGAYPRMEWLSEKPRTDDFYSFARAYGEFLNFRLKGEFDELYLLLAPNIAGTFALVYRFEGKNIPWFPEDIKNNCVFLEFFMVHPSHQGKGFGHRMLSLAMRKARELGKDLCVVTFEDLPAYTYYLKRGFRPIRKDGTFVTLILETSK